MLLCPIHRDLTPEDVKPVKSSGHPHFSTVVAALLYLAAGGAGLDHAHNLCTPLCWGAPTP